MLSASFTGVFVHEFEKGAWTRTALTKGDPTAWPKSGSSDIVVGHLDRERFFATIEPWHGNQVVVYRQEKDAWTRTVIDTAITDGHTLVAVISTATDATSSWPASAAASAVSTSTGSAIHARTPGKKSVLDDGMAGAGCAVADLNADKRPDIVCIGWATANLKWYENTGVRRAGLEAGLHRARMMRLLLTSGLALLTAALASQQVEPRRNPLANSPATIAAGQNLFDRTCQTCHGPGGQGDRAPALTRATFLHGHEDAEIFRTIRDGVRGSQMPPYADHTEEEIWQLVAYIQSLRRPPAAATSRPGRGAAPPPLVVARTQDGREIRGIRRNEDTFTVQIVDAAGRLHSLDKLTLAAYRVENAAPPRRAIRFRRPEG